jgi:trigger factor
VAVTKEIKRLDKSNINLTITVPKDDVCSKYHEMMKDYIKNVQIPGFRKGKVPKEVLERKYADALKQEALGKIIESALHDIFTEENLPRNERPLPYSDPELQGESKLDLEQDLQFSVIYDVLPDVKIGQWKGLKVEHPYAEIEDKDIENELKVIQGRNTIVMDKDDDEAAAKDDVVTINYKIFEEDGIKPSNMQREDFTFTLGANTNALQFDNDIIGMKKGETKEYNKTFSGDYFEAELAGKVRKVQITLVSLKEKQLPNIDDDLAQDVDEKFKTLDDLKNNIKEKLNRNLERRLREVKTNELLKEIMENTPVVLPESMIKAEIESRWRRLAHYYNTNAQTLVQMMSGGDGYKEREKEWRETAGKALHSRIIIETLMEEQKTEASDEDVEKEFETMAMENGVEISEIKKHYDEQAMFNLKEEIRERQIIDLLFTENTLKPGKKENYPEFMTDNG